VGARVGEVGERQPLDKKKRGYLRFLKERHFRMHACLLLLLFCYALCIVCDMCIV